MDESFSKDELTALVRIVALVVLLIMMIVAVLFVDEVIDGYGERVCAQRVEPQSDDGYSDSVCNL